jgi:hypothetical protein
MTNGLAKRDRRLISHLGKDGWGLTHFPASQISVEFVENWRYKTMSMDGLAESAARQGEFLRLNLGMVI